MRGVLILLALAALVAAAPAHGQEPPVVADGVTIAGVEVGGMTEVEAVAAVRAFFGRRLAYRFGARTYIVRPWALGARARVSRAVDAALAAPAGTALGLRVEINHPRLWRWVHTRAAQFFRPARDARVSLRNLRPRISKARPGRKLDRSEAARRLLTALRTHRRGPLWLPSASIPARVTRANFGPVVVIRRGSRALYLYRRMTSAGMSLVRSFRVAVGQPSYPTPLGRWRIVTKQKNPWWNPPDADWADGAEPIPPGPGNPLGTRWMGLSAGGVGIHGTYNEASIGGFASHGCIRMYLNEAEWLFDRVRLGTTVFIVGA